MYKYLYLQFFRSKVTIVALALLFVLGIISIGVGKKFVVQQQAGVTEITTQQKQHLDRLLKYENKEMGLFLYYTKFAYINPITALAGLSIGQRDINSSIQANTIRGIEAQKYDTDLRNPYQLMVGNFDLSFVILYLFPLVIIVLTFNLYSQEKEQGTWPLVKAQTKNVQQYLWYKLSVPFLSISILLFLLFVVAKIILNIPLQAAFITYACSAFLYLCFWFSMVMFIVSFYKSSSSNAISMLSIWLLLTILLPAAVNNYISKKYTVPESLSTMLKQRDGYHTKWDIPQDSVMKIFFAAYPQHKNAVWNGAGFNYMWYYAMQHCGDMEAQTDSRLFMQKLEQREASSKAISYFVPTIHMQLLGTELAKTDLQNHLQFLDSSTAFHEKLRLQFYPKIFGDSAVVKTDWKKYEPIFFKTTQKEDAVKMILPFLVLTMLFMISSIILLKNRK